MVGTLINVTNPLGGINLNSTASSISSQFVNYPNDALFGFEQGLPENGSVYYNTTLGCVRVFSNGAWYNDLNVEPWQNSTMYLVGQIVWAPDLNIYRCVIMHTSSAGPATIDDDALNWTRMGAHELGQLKDVDFITEPQVDGDTLRYDGVLLKWLPVAHNKFDIELQLKELAVKPSAPPAGYVKLYSMNGKILIQNSTGEETQMLAQYNVVDFLDATVLDASTIDNTAVAYKEVVASLATNVKGVQIFDTAGIDLGWYDGSNNLLFVSGPGTSETTFVEIPAGTLIKVKALVADAPFSGNYIVNFLG